MNINPAMFTNIKRIFNFFRKVIFQILPGFHSITGCDTASYSFGVAQIGALKKCNVLAKWICYKIWEHMLTHLKG